MTGPLPELLEQPVIPSPLHGLNPRNLMGKAAWDEERRRVYRKYGFTCAACGVNGRDAFPQTRLEAHERFSVDYRARTMTLTGMEPLCPACHAFVHTGLLELRMGRNAHEADGRAKDPRARGLGLEGIRRDRPPRGARAVSEDGGPP